MRAGWTASVPACRHGERKFLWLSDQRGRGDRLGLAAAVYHACNANPAWPAPHHGGGCVGAVTLVARLHPSPADGAGQGAWSAWHLLQFVREYCPSVGVSDELMDAVRGDGAEAKEEL